MVLRTTLKPLATAVAAISLTFTLAACGDDDAAKVKEKSTENPANIVDDGSDQPTDEETTDAPTAAQLGDLVTVGNWDIKVTGVKLDAAALIKKANQFNDPAKGQYVLVSYEATYTGSERRASTDGDLTWSFTTVDQQINNPASQVTPADNQEWPSEARVGGTVKQQVLFDLPAGQIKGGTLTVEAFDDDFDTVYADFPVN